MKINRLTARVLAVFAAVLLVTALSVPAFAATEYVFEGTDQGICVYNGHLPEGTYAVSIRVSTDDGIYYLPFENPVDIVYSFVEDNIDCPYYFETRVLVHEEGEEPLWLDFVVGYSDSYGSNQQPFSVASLYDGNEEFVADFMDLIFTPYSPFPSLADYVSAETLPTVFNEIISLLPIALGVLVDYIAIRKGISYLQSFLHNS